MTAGGPGLRVTEPVQVTRSMSTAPVGPALGYSGIVAVILLAARYSLADHLGAPRIGLVTTVATAIMTALVVALVGFARRAAAHLAGALAILAGVGTALAYRFSAADGRHQVVTTAAAAVVFVAVAVTGRRSGGWMRLRRIRRALGVAGIALIAAPFVPVLGLTSGGARLFVRLPGVTVEPGLLGAVFIGVAVASGLAAEGDLLGFAGLWALREPPAALLGSGIGAVAALSLTLLAHDLGSAVVLSAALITCLAAGTHRVRYPAAVAVGLAVGAAIAWPHLAYVSVRILNWQHPLAPGLGGGLTQVADARYALAWGGLLGHGLGSGQVFGPAALPAATSDYAFVQLSSETGVLPALGVLAALAIVTVAAWALVAQARTGDDQLVGTGAAILLTAPCLLLIAGVAGVMPLTGTPVPLFEVGASAAIAAATAAGLLAGGARDDMAVDVLKPKGGFARLRNFPVLAATASVLLLAVAATMFVDEGTDLGLARAASSPYLLASAPVLRGSILTADGTVLADSTGTGSLDTAARHYPATGIDGVDISGVAIPRASQTGLEASEDSQLRCGAAAIEPGSLSNAGLPADIDPARCSPADVVTTISTPVQRAAVSALRGLHAVAVVLDAGTGAILAMAASPATVNPNSVVTPDLSADLARLARSPSTLAGAIRSPLFNPATSLGEAPGSLYKLLLGPAYAAAHLTPGVVPDASSVRIVARDGALGALDNAGGETCGGDLTATITVSCDTAAAELAQVVGRHAMITVATELGLTSSAAVSGVPVISGELGVAVNRSQAQAAVEAAHPGVLDADLAMSAIGQASVRLTPMSVATLGAEIVTGRRVRPYLTAAVCRAGQTLAGDTPSPGRVVPGTSLDLPGMANVIYSPDGTAHSLLTDAAPAARDLVGAKTGTAQLPDGDQLAWLVAAVHYADVHAASRTAIVAAIVLPTAADPHPVGGVDAAAVAGPILDAAATHPPSRATITAGAGVGGDTAVCAATKPR